jgi:hypothetical protein
MPLKNSISDYAELDGICDSFIISLEEYKDLGLLCTSYFKRQQCHAYYCSSGKKVPSLWLSEKIIIPCIPAWKKGLVWSWPGEPSAAGLYSTPEKTRSQIHSPWLGDLVDSSIGFSHPPVCPCMYPGGSVRQPCAGVNYIPQVRDCEFGYCFEHKAPLQF